MTPAAPASDGAAAAYAGAPHKLTCGSGSRG
jgi:hypothetical protein